MPNELGAQARDYEEAQEMALRAAAGAVDPLSGAIMSPSQQALQRGTKILEGLYNGIEWLVQFPRKSMINGLTTEKAIPWATNMALNTVGTGAVNAIGAASKAHPVLGVGGGHAVQPQAVHAPEGLSSGGGGGATKATAPSDAQIDEAIKAIEEALGIKPVQPESGAAQLVQSAAGQNAAKTLAKTPVHEIGGIKWGEVSEPNVMASFVGHDKQTVGGLADFLSSWGNESLGNVLGFGTKAKYYNGFELEPELAQAVGQLLPKNKLDAAKEAAERFAKQSAKKDDVFVDAPGSGATKSATKSASVLPEDINVEASSPYEDFQDFFLQHKGKEAGQLTDNADGTWTLDVPDLPNVRVESAKEAQKMLAEHLSAKDNFRVNDPTIRSEGVKKGEISFVPGWGGTHKFALELPDAPASVAKEYDSLAAAKSAAYKWLKSTKDTEAQGLQFNNLGKKNIAKEFHQVTLHGNDVGEIKHYDDTMMSMLGAPDINKPYKLALQDGVAKSGGWFPSFESAQKAALEWATKQNAQKPPKFGELGTSANPELPPEAGIKSEAQRRADALAGGYTTTAYRGTAKPTRQVPRTGFDGEYYSTASPQLAEDYARNYRVGTPEIQPLKINTKDYLVVDGEGKKWKDVNRKAINEAKKQGKLGVVLHNVLDEPKNTSHHGPQTVYITLHNGLHTLRGKFAQFNPERFGERNLLAGLGGAAAVGPAVNALGGAMKEEKRR